MAPKTLLIALGMIAAGSAASATTRLPPGTPAPPGTATTKYCLRLEPITGSHLSLIRCKTREEWDVLEVNVDEEWAENGVGVING